MSTTTFNAAEAARAEQRITELEIKAAYAEDLLEQLNLLVYRQQEQITALARELIELRHQQSDDRANSSRSPREELPPHY